MKIAATTTLFLALACFVAPANASFVASWSNVTPTSATGDINGVGITASTSAAAPFWGVSNNRFAMVGGSWDAPMPLEIGDQALVTTNVNGGEYQQFDFASAVSNLLFYIENFDSSSIASITAVGSTGIELVAASSSMSFDSGTNTLSTSNATYNGEGDAVLRVNGPVTSIRLDYSSGTGDNGVFYGFEQDQPHAVPEPASMAVMGGCFAIGSVATYLRRRKQAQSVSTE